MSQRFRAHVPADQGLEIERTAQLLGRTSERAVQSAADELRALASRCEALSASQQALRERCDELGAAEQAMRASGSRRLTAPVRFVYRLVTGRST
jgi:hypothetical protein